LPSISQATSTVYYLEREATGKTPTGQRDSHVQVSPTQIQVNRADSIGCDSRASVNNRAASKRRLPSDATLLETEARRIGRAAETREERSRSRQVGLRITAQNGVAQAPAKACSASRRGRPRAAWSIRGPCSWALFLRSSSCRHQPPGGLGPGTIACWALRPPGARGQAGQGRPNRGAEGSRQESSVMVPTVSRLSSARCRRRGRGI
jgi:hypothetical protein